MAAVSLAVCLLASSSRAVEVPPGFAAETIARGINAATALAVAPDSRVVIADQTGHLLVWKDGRLLDEPALKLHVTDYWERGLIGLALDPGFPRTQHLYLLYVTDRPYVHHVLSRFTMAGDIVDPGSEKVLLEGDDQAKQGGGVPAGHQGGPLCFGADGKLYVALGEQTNGALSPRLDSLSGKVLRLDADGGIPADNPFFAAASGKYRAIWAIGLRNPFGLAFEPGTGRLFENDVGQTSWEEINEIVPGGNYGWPAVEGATTDSAYRNPIHAYPPAVGRSITGGVFYTAPSGAPYAFPSPWSGKYLFLDFMASWLRAIDPARPRSSDVLARHLDSPVALAVAPDGSLLVLNRGTIWRDGKRFQPHAGSLVRIRHLGAGAPAPGAPAAAFPPRLSGTGLFASLAPLEPSRDFEELCVNLPPWQPGVRARRWLSVPPGGALHVTADGELILPAGARLVQQYDLEASPAEPFETHVLWFTGGRRARGAAWRWRGPGEATLVEDAEVLALPGPPGRQWVSPMPDEELDIDQPFTGFIVPLDIRQLNCRQQLERWNERGQLSRKLSAGELARLPRLAALDDASATLEHRVRSYLDVNCSGCHRPGGPSRAAYDARLSTPLGEQKLIGAEPVAGDLGVQGARLVAPGDPERSVLLLRLRRQDALRMPPPFLYQGELRKDAPPVLPLLEEWIRSLR